MQAQVDIDAQAHPHIHLHTALLFLSSQAFAPVVLTRMEQQCSCKS